MCTPSEAARARWFLSVTECEVEAGLHRNDARGANSHVIVRTLRGLRAEAEREEALFRAETNTSKKRAMLKGLKVC